MIFFADNNGTIIKTVPEPVYQGSAGANNIYLVAPFAKDMAVTVAFQLPNGVWTTPRLMKSGALMGEEMAQVGDTLMDELGNLYAVWSYSLPSDITAYYGTVTVQFFFYAAQEGMVIASSATSFTVGRGVPPDLSGIKDPDVYKEILENITALQRALKKGEYAARSFYPWNSQVTYNAGEIVYYPSVGDYGVFVKAQTQNTNKPPYVNGSLDIANWSEVIDFNTLNDLYNVQEQVKQSAAAAANSANSAMIFSSAASSSAAKAKTSEANASASAENAATSETNASDSAKSAKESAEAAKETVDGLKAIIPSDASSENPLTTRDFVNSSINNMAAFYITYDAAGNAFPTRASLFNATTYYYGGQPRTPTQNDYAIVLSDESKPVGVDGTYPTTRYSYQGAQWSFQYVVNNTSLTQDQVNAINSGITAQKIADMDEEIDGKVSKSGDTMTGPLTLTSESNDLAYTNEFNFAKNYSHHGQDMHINYRGTTVPIDTYYFCTGQSNGNLASICVNGEVNRGALTFEGEGNGIKFKHSTRDAYAIRFYKGATEGYGDVVQIGDGGMTIIGAGEAADTVKSRTSNLDNEQLILAADDDIRIVAGADNYSEGNETVKITSTGLYEKGQRVYSPNNPPPTGGPSIICLHNILLTFVVSGITYTVNFTHYDNDYTPINTPTALNNRLFGDLSSGSLLIPCSGIRNASGSLQVFYNFEITKNSNQIRFYYYVVDIPGAYSGNSSFAIPLAVVSDTVCIYENNSL